MKGTSYLTVKLYDEEDNCQEYFLGVQWEVTSAPIGEEKGWYTEIIHFPEGITEEVKQKLRAEVHNMYEDLVFQNDSDDYGEQYD